MIRLINFNEASRSHKSRIKATIKEKLLQIQSDILLPHGLKLRRVEIHAQLTQINQEIANTISDIAYFKTGEDEIPITKVIYIKDTNNISDATYSSLRKELNLKLPNLHELKKEIVRCDGLFEIMENTKGFYISVEEKLKK